MSIAIPSPQKPIQLYLWSKCGYCVKQKSVFGTMSPFMLEWMRLNVALINVETPSSYPMVKGYPFWVVNGSPNPGFKSLEQIMSLKNIVESQYR
jgi:hypothetical protein